MQNTNALQRIVFTLFWFLLFMSVIIEWRILKFTGAFVFLIPVTVIGIEGRWSPLSITLAVLCIPFCVAWML